ncbi:MAG: T9SS type A sorting domain-containing protein [Candidatus Eisenbacteria bacterium]
MRKNPQGRASGAWALRLIAVAVVAAGWITIASSAAGAETVHYVFGLHHGTLYTVYANGQEIVEDELCGPGRTLRFEANVASPVEVSGRESATSEVGEGSGAEALHVEGPFPNPSRGAARISLDSPVDGVARLALIDPTSGRRLAEERHAVSAGSNTLATPAPSRLGSGVYVLRIEVAGRTEERKLIVAR